MTAPSTGIVGTGWFEMRGTVEIVQPEPAAFANVAVTAASAEVVADSTTL